MHSPKVDAVSVRGRAPRVSRGSAKSSSALNSGSLRLTSVFFLWQSALACFCHGFSISDEQSGKASFLSLNGSSNCLKTYRINASDSCASLRLNNSLSQQQLLLLNPDLTCQNLKAGQVVCVQGVPPNCKKKVHVGGGRSADGGCETVAAIDELTVEELLLMNPGIICPDVKNQSSVWSTSQQICVAMGPGSIFIEYMGASGVSIVFNDMKPVVDASTAVFHIVLGFVIDYAQDGTYANGAFSQYWNENLTSESARAFKMNNPGVRLLMSLGGASLWVNDSYTADVQWFDPPDPEAWIANAQDSLTSIADMYMMDGIDIDFEHFPPNYPTSNSTFTYCIGTLIQRLKGNNTIGIATIAPFDDVISQYQDLVANYGDLIDYISFQFYAYDIFTVADYVEKFRETTLMFDPTKLLASTQTNGNHSITGRPFQQAVKQLQDENGLLGVMMYDADGSQSLNFADEIAVLAMIPGPYDGKLPTQAPPPMPAQGRRALDSYQWRWHSFCVVVAVVMYSLLDL